MGFRPPPLPHGRYYSCSWCRSIKRLHHLFCPHGAGNYRFPDRLWGSAVYIHKGAIRTASTKQTSMLFENLPCFINHFHAFYKPLMLFRDMWCFPHPQMVSSFVLLLRSPTSQVRFNNFSHRALRSTLSRARRFLEKGNVITHKFSQ